MERMCDCVSYNRPDLCVSDGRREVILQAPPHIKGKPHGICVDACIADAIRMLWSHEVITTGCCCGHNLYNPSVIIDGSEDPSYVRSLLAERDGRNWEVGQWQLVWRGVTKCE